jgi:hypothetical protein
VYDLSRRDKLSKDRGSPLGVGTITFRRFCGTEVFALRKAELLLLKGDGYCRLGFNFEADEVPTVTTVPEVESLSGSPGGEFNVEVASLDVRSLVGQVFTIPHGEDDGHWLARIYYLDHCAAKNCTLRILERDGERFRASVNGSCTDFDYCDGSKPDTRFSLQAWFALRG